jgi:hypothetical protein
MNENIHKYLCVFCKNFIFGANVIRLAANLNNHNLENHPMESANWTGSGIIFSSHYVGPASPNVNWEPNKVFDRGDVIVDTRQSEPLRAPRREYTEPHGTSENRFMTEEGRRVLADLKVKW